MFRVRHIHTNMQGGDKSLSPGPVDSDLGSSNSERKLLWLLLLKEREREEEEEEVSLCKSARHRGRCGEEI